MADGTGDVWRVVWVLGRLERVDHLFSRAQAHLLHCLALW